MSQLYAALKELLPKLHRPLHEPWPWFSPLVVKWLVVLSQLNAALKKLFPNLHVPLHEPWSSPLAVVVV
ncbi:hypothetical protein H5410_003283, partial [Solanum commersonii]